MDFISAAIGNVVNIVVLCIFAFGILKVLQIANTLDEIKDGLAEFRRNAALIPMAMQSQERSHSGPGTSTSNTSSPVDLMPQQSGEEMLRALDRELSLPPASRDAESAERLRTLRANIEASRPSFKKS